MAQIGKYTDGEIVVRFTSTELALLVACFPDVEDGILDVDEVLEAMDGHGSLEASKGVMEAMTELSSREVETFRADTL